MSTFQNLDSGWQFFEPASQHFLTAKVPGCIHTDLLAHQLIPDPFWGSNERDLQWIEEADWIYRCEFEADAALFAFEKVELVADGLDTVAAISLNGVLIAKTDNMFIGFRFNVAGTLKPGRNVLEVTFTAPLKTIRARQKPDDFLEWNDPVGGSSHLRKEQCSFGWDWGPRFATSGIYKALRLEAWSTNRFESVLIRQKHAENGVELTFDTRLAAEKSGEIRGAVSFNGQIVAAIEDGKSRIENPRLWWPNTLGAQPLYDVTLELIDDGKVLETWTRKIGLRTIELDRHPDEFGESFQFKVNGRPIFSKGANWIPAHSFVTEATPELYRDLLASAAEANMNMIRVWGGGIYESDSFYDICDELGLLVWQDFMFACAQYPGDAAFLDSVKIEAEYQVQRLAHRACLALWCGNNEIEQMPTEILKTAARKKAYDDIFYRILPAAVERFDGVTPYWPSSPHNPEGYEKGFNNEGAGDAHFWDVWHARKPVKRYEEQKFRFCSEFGMQSYASPEVAETFCPPAEMNVFSPAMENHQKNAAGNLIILDYVSRLYRFPKDYAALAYLSQLNQAHCMRVGVEHFRRAMPRTMGALYWQLNDCWPVASWSSIEFGGRWKALHYAAKRFFAPLLVSAHVHGDEVAKVGNYTVSTIHQVDLYSVFDAPEDTSGLLSWTLFHLDGRRLEEQEWRVELKYGESRLQKSLDFAEAMKTHGAGQIYLRIRLKTESGAVSENTVFLTAPRFINLPKAPIATGVKFLKENEFEVTFESPAFQHQVQFHLAKTRYSADDNFFDLYPGEPKTVRVKLASPLSRAEVEARLSTYSLADSY